MRVGLVAVASMLAIMAPQAVLAQAQQGDRTGFSAIAAGDFAAAENRIVAERRIFPDRPELMLNLAAVYGRTGREQQARALYVAVMERPDTLMDMPGGGTASSHALAKAGLRRASGIAAR